MNNLSASNIRGFSLIEVLISLAILGFGLLAVTKLQATLLTGVDHARQVTEAINIAQGEIEELRGFSAIESGTGNDYASIVNNPCKGSGTNDGNDTNTDFKCDVELLGYDDEDGYKTITVTVTWTDQTNELREIALTSKISRSDPAISGKLMLADGAGAIPFP